MFNISYTQGVRTIVYNHWLESLKDGSKLLKTSIEFTTTSRDVSAPLFKKKKKWLSLEVHNFADEETERVYKMFDKQVL